MIDWTKPIEVTDGRKARLLGEIRNRSGCNRVVAIDDGVDEFMAYFNDAGQPANCNKPWIRNVPPPPAKVLVTLYRNTATGVVKAFVLHRPCSDWDLIGTVWAVEGQFAEEDGT
jgi:hypothetical protein